MINVRNSDPTQEKIFVNNKMKQKPTGDTGKVK